MKKKKFIALLLIIAITLTACSGGNTENTADMAGKTVITFWHSMGGVHGNALDGLIEKYNNSQDEYFVEAEYQGNYDDALTKLRASSAGKDVGTDLIQVYEIGTRFMIDSGLVVPMQDYIDKNNYDLSRIEPALSSYYTVDGMLYSMPFNSSTPLLYFNKDLFEEVGIEEPPTTLDEVIEVGKILEEKTDVQMPISLRVYGWWVEQFMSKQNLPMFNNDNGREANPTEVVFGENGGMLNILKKWEEMHDSGIAPNVGKQGGVPEFVSGTSGMTFASTATLKQILNEVGGAFEVGTAYFPSVNPGDTGSVTIGGASIYMIETEDEDRKDGSWDFIEFLISPESQAYWNSETGYFPINLDAHDESVFKENLEQYPQFQTAIDQLHDSNTESEGGLTTVYQESRQIIEKYLEEILNGNINAEDASDKIADEVNKALENYNSTN